MKDLKHYFTDNSSACDTSKVVTKEVTTTRNDEANDNRASEEEQTSLISTSKKRGRVKIKISRKNSRGKICDIVESNKSDLVDKTPSPFTHCDITDDNELSPNDTPKRTKSRKTVKSISSMKITNSTITTESTNENVCSGDENDNLISNGNCKIDSTECPNGAKDPLRENIENSLAEITAMEREESNAFQVLMTRKKSLQYRNNVTPAQLDDELARKIAEEGKNRLRQNKEKLISMADKKGYSKRKLNEIDEGERIEKRLEKRAKVFKQMGKKETDDKNTPLSSRRVCPGSLHDYFSKAVSEEKDATVASGIIVEAEVHIPNSLVLANIETAKPKKLLKSNSKEVKEALATTDNIQVFGSPDLLLESGESQSSQRRNKKPRWSLRINLQCNDRDNEAGSVEGSTEKTRRDKESRSRRVKVKKSNNSENESNELTEPSVKGTKKKKKSTTIKNSNNSTREKIHTSDTQSEVLTASPIVTSAKKPQSSSESPEIIEMLDVKIGSRQSTEKLAPLFVKRQKPDPAVMEARRAFLHTISMENYDRTNERQAPIVGLPILPFPSISHVTQLNIDAKIDNSRYNKTFRTRDTRKFIPNFDLKEFKSITSLAREESRNSNNEMMQMTKSNIEEVLCEIESRCSDAREIWTRISSKTGALDGTKKSPKRRGKKKKSVDKKNDISTSDQINDNSAWTEKYRPTSARDIVGNEEGAEKFRKWLNGWKVNLEKTDNSSGDDFYSSDCSYARGNENNQVAVLLGPHGSGKTASVYAIAEELGYSVLEINASSKRAGKKILKDLEEATKSHRIRSHDFTPLKSLTSDNEKKNPQNSLILVEDVDLIFEEDEGFISATCQLVSNTKRPIVMTGRNVCSHLNRMAPEQLRIYYQTTVGTRVSALLELITLAESSYRLPRSCHDRLLQNGDLRKALLQLQYLLISGKPSASEVPTNFHQTLWQDMHQCIYKPAIRGTKKSTKRKLVKAEKSSCSSLPSKEPSIMNNLANDLDKLSFLSTMLEIDDPAIEITSLKLEASLSLDESTHDYSRERVTSVEIAKWLRDRLMNKNITIDCGGNNLQNFRQLSLKKELNVGVNLALSQVTPHNVDRRAVMLDYLSSIRTICRAEEVRTTQNNKRGNRFFHYLQNLRVPTLATRPNILAAACKIMREKSSES